MLTAVKIFNNPQIEFKSELFIVTNIIAWTYLSSTLTTGKGELITAGETWKQSIRQDQAWCGVPLELENPWRAVIARLTTS